MSSTLAFTILEEDNLALSVRGNHSIAILRVSKNYNDLLQSLQDIISEAQDLETVTINDISNQIQLFLGGDWKFLAIICGLESATSQHACIWCKCSKTERCDRIWNGQLQIQQRVLEPLKRLLRKLN